MDFSYTEEQQAIFDLAAQILQNGASQERLREIEDGAGPGSEAPRSASRPRRGRP